MEGNPVLDVKVQVAIDEADATEIDHLTRQLRRELLDLDVDDVQPAQVGTPPSGARGIDAASLGGLVISIGQAADGLAAALAVIKNWVSRRPDRKVRLEIDGDVIELTAATIEQQQRLADAWLARHG